MGGAYGGDMRLSSGKIKMSSASSTGRGFLPASLILFFMFAQAAYPLGGKPYVRFEGRGFPLSSHGISAPLCASTHDHSGVLRALKLFRTDIGAVTGVAAGMFLDALPS